MGAGMLQETNRTNRYVIFSFILPFFFHHFFHLQHVQLTTYDLILTHSLHRSCLGNPVHKAKLKTKKDNDAPMRVILLSSKIYSTRLAAFPEYRGNWTDFELARELLTDLSGFYYVLFFSHLISLFLCLFVLFCCFFCSVLSSGKTNLRRKSLSLSNSSRALALYRKLQVRTFLFLLLNLSFLVVVLRRTDLNSSSRHILIILSAKEEKKPQKPAVMSPKKSYNIGELRVFAVAIFFIYRHVCIISFISSLSLGCTHVMWRSCW